MGDRELRHVLGRSIHYVQHLGVWVVVTDDLLFEQAGEERLQLERVRNHSEAFVGRLLPGDIVARQRIGELFGDEVANLLLGARLDFGRRLVSEANGFFDHRDRLRHLGGVGSLVLGLLTLAGRHQRDHTRGA